MPLYNYRCEKGHEFEAFNKIAERLSIRCTTCGSIAHQRLSKRPPAVHPFKFGYFEHTSPDGDYARNKAEMRSICERRGVYAPGVLD